MLTVRPDVTAAKAYLKQLEQVEIRRVVGRALTRSAAAAKTFSSRKLRERINLPKVLIDQAIRTRRSNEVRGIKSLDLETAWFEIRWSGHPFALRDYAARPTRKGVTFKVARNGPRKLYMRQGRAAFIVEKLGRQVFVRVGADPPGPRKAKIVKVFGPSIPQFAMTKREREQLIDHVTEFFVTEVIRNAKFALSRRGF
jgi:hypothetical protein